MPDMQLRPEDAATGCAGCTHPAAMHEVGVDDWRCLVSGCTCAAFNQIELKFRPGLPIEVVHDVADAAAVAAANEQLAAASARIDNGEMDDAIAAGVEAAAAALDAGTDPVEATRQAMTERLPTNTDVIEAAVEQHSAALDAALGDIPIRRRTPPPRPKPTPPKRPEGIALRFARAVASDPPPPGEWVRLDQKVSRAIVNDSAREFAKAFGLRLSVILDHEDPDDPTSPRYHHLFCHVLDDDDDVKIEGRP